MGHEHLDSGLGSTLPVLAPGRDNVSLSPDGHNMLQVGLLCPLRGHKQLCPRTYEGGQRPIPKLPRTARKQEDNKYYAQFPFDMAIVSDDAMQNHTPAHHFSWLGRPGIATTRSTPM